MVAPRTAVINPYAPAEVVTGRRINWKQVEGKRRLLEDILQTPYEELFDPKFNGPLYFGFSLNEALDLVPERSPLLDVELKIDTSDLEVPYDAIAKIERLSDLEPRG